MEQMVHKASLVRKAQPELPAHPDPLVRQALKVTEDPREQTVIRALRARKALRGLKAMQASWAKQAQRERKAQQVQSVIQGLQEPRAQRDLWAQWGPPVPKDRVDQPDPKDQQDPPDQKDPPA
jgi:hypothetical protein